MCELAPVAAPNKVYRWRSGSWPTLTPGFAPSWRDRFNAKPGYLFGYGTLLTGTPDETINRLIRDALRPKCRAYIYGRLHDLGSYPGAVPLSDRSEKVFGQVFAVERLRRVLSALDAYEGYRAQHPHQSEFVRRTATAMQLSCQGPLTVWVYYYNGRPKRSARLPSGDYLLASKCAGATRHREVRRSPELDGGRSGTHP